MYVCMSYANEFAFDLRFNNVDSDCSDLQCGTCPSTFNWEKV